MPTPRIMVRRDAAGRAGAAGAPDAESERVFAAAAELFRLLSTPMRLRIIGALCAHEKNVSQLLAEIDATQPNMSQHLGALYRAGVLARRRDATQVYYRIASERAAMLCRAVCAQIAAEIGASGTMPSGERLVPGVAAAAALRDGRQARSRTSATAARSETRRAPRRTPRPPR